MKRIINITGWFVDMGSLRRNESALLTMPNGDTIKTSAVESFFVSGSVVRIETRNTIYKNF